MTEDFNSPQFNFVLGTLGSLGYEAVENVGTFTRKVPPGPLPLVCIYYLDSPHECSPFILATTPLISFAAFHNLRHQHIIYSIAYNYNNRNMTILVEQFRDATDEVLFEKMIPIS